MQQLKRKAEKKKKRKKSGYIIQLEIVSLHDIITYPYPPARYIWYTCVSARLSGSVLYKEVYHRKRLIRC